MQTTLFVELLGGPGCGKSTTNALTFGALKQRGRNVEIIHEFAKELSWSGLLDSDHFTQLDIATEQFRRMRRLDGKVEAALSDTSALLGLVYNDEICIPAFRTWLQDEYRRWNTLTIFLERDIDRAYNPFGRGQTKDEAEGLDEQVAMMLEETGQDYHVIKVDKDNHSHVDEIIQLIDLRPGYENR